MDGPLTTIVAPTSAAIGVGNAAAGRAVASSALRPQLKSTRLAPPLLYLPMLLALLPVCVGICISYYLLRGLSHAFEIQWCLSLFGLLAWFGFRKASHDRFAMIPLCLALAAAAGAWHDLRRNYFSVDELARYATQSPQPVCCEALAVGAPQPVPAPPFDPLRSIPPSPQCRLLVDVVALRNGTE